MRIGIPWNQFLNVFPIHSEFFNPSHDIDLSDPTLQVLIQVLDQGLSPDSEFKAPDEQSSNINLYFQAEEKGNMIACLEYDHVGQNGDVRTNVAVVVGEICMASISKEQFLIIPHFHLTGQKKTIEAVPVMISEAMLCRVIDAECGNTPRMLELDVSEPGIVTEGLCYADECFRRILADLHLDVVSAQQWIEADDKTLEARRDKIISRTPQQLLTEVQLTAKKSQVDSVTQFQMPAPTGYQ